MKSDKVYTRHGVPISVTGIAQVCSKGGIVSVKAIPRLHKIACRSHHIAKGWKIFKAMLQNVFESVMSLWRNDSYIVLGLLSFLFRGVTFSSHLHFQVKIQGQNKEMLATACQMFMGKSEGEIAQIALETLEGHQRAIIAHLTVEVCNDSAEWRTFFP